jgi:hypothetical protein
MGNGEDDGVSVSNARSDEAVAAELNADSAGEGWPPSSTVRAVRTAAVRYGAFISYSHAASA